MLLRPAPSPSGSACIHQTPQAFVAFFGRLALLEITIVYWRLLPPRSGSCSSKTQSQVLVVTRDWMMHMSQRISWPEVIFLWPERVRGVVGSLPLRTTTFP